MTSKTSQKTEDMLDQTFQNFDSEQTVNTQSSDGGSTTGGINKNTKKLIAIGVGCVGIAGYLFVLKPSLDKSEASSGIPVAQAPTPTPVPSPTTVPTPTPVAIPEPTPAPIAVQNPTPEPSPVNQVANNNISVNPVVTNDQQVKQPEVQISVPSVQIQPQTNQQAQIDVVPQQTQVQQNQPTDINVDVNNGKQQIDVKVDQPKQTSNIVVDEIVSRFDKLDQQNNEFKNMFTDIDGKLSTIQSSLVEQQGINQKVDQRLTALEDKSNKVSGQSSKSEKAQQTKSTVSKSKAKVEVIKEKEIVEKITIKPTKSPARVDIHSVYGGRVWVKNSDGSLSTYAAGDKLPTGEVIKIVDDENLEIVTDLRVIKN